MLSVIIPVHNGEKHISKCLDAILDSSYHNYEIIVISDASQDKTDCIVLKYSSVFFIRNERNRGASYSRNKGAIYAKGDILVFLDSDVVVFKDTLKKIAENFEKSSIDAVFGLYDYETPVNNFISKFKNLQHHYIHLRNKGKIKTFWTGCGAIKKNIFNKVGGFDENIGFMEDINLGHKLSQNHFSTVLDLRILCQHLKNYTFRSFVKSELYGRAIPWSRLILDKKAPINCLNTDIRNVFSILTLFLMCGCIFLTIFSLRWLFILPFLLIIILFLNFGFLHYIIKKKGVKFSFLSYWILLVHYFLAGFGAFVAFIEYLLNRTRRKQ